MVFKNFPFQVLLAVAVSAEAEADAQYLSTYGVHTPVVASTYHHGVGHSVVAPAVHPVAAPVVTSAYTHAIPTVHSVATPVVSSYSNILNRGVYGLNRGVYGLNRGVYGLNHGVYGSALGGHYYGKREAEAEPEADAQYYASTYAHGVHAPVVASTYHHGAAHSVASIATVAHSTAPIVTSAYRAAVPAVYNAGVYGLNRGVYGLNSGIYGSAYNGYSSVGYTGNYYG